MESDKKIVSVVTPCFNEEDSILNCYEVVKEIFKDLKNVDYEHIFSDNSSTDSTQDILKKIAYPQLLISLYVILHIFVQIILFVCLSSLSVYIAIHVFHGNYENPKYRVFIPV